MISAIQLRFPARPILTIRNYVYISTILGVFSGAAVYRAGFDILFFYFIVISNLLLLSFELDLSYIPLWVVGICSYLFASGAIGIWNGTDSVTQFLKQFIGITISILYFYYFFKLQDNQVDRVFRSYARIAYWVCIVGLVIWGVSCIAAGEFVRLQSITTEPAHFCTLVLPAYYWYAYRYISSREYGLEVAIFTVAIILSGSSLGYLSVAFGMVLLGSRRKKLILFVPLVAGGLLSLSYFASPYFRVRIDDTILAMTLNDVSQANISTYALISNLIVTEKVFEESPFLGNGLGSHVISHGRYIDNVPGVEVFVEQGMENFNSTEAASLALRVISELGVAGFLAVLSFLIHFRVSGSGERAAISNGILVCFFLKLIRDGVYFPPEQFFFVFIYFLNYRQFKFENSPALKVKSEPLHLSLARRLRAEKEGTTGAQC
jgi:hypothetical protein